MRRRAFLVGAAGVAATAGCLSAPDSGDRHPFAGETVTVRIDEQSVTEHDLRANAEAALDYWEEHSPTYAGFDVEFEIIESGEPDMVIVYADDPRGCEEVPGYSERVLGCAPLLGPGIRVPQPVVARVVAAARPIGKIRITAKHEVGHVLGLGHDDEPLEIMSNLPEHRIPLYSLRIDIWERVNGATERTNEANPLYSHAIERWNAGDYAAAGPAFEAAGEAFADAGAIFEEAHGMADGFEGHPRVETVDLERVRSLLSTLAERSNLVASAAGSMAEASEAAAAGDGETANARRADANADIAAFRDLEPVQVRDVAVALGLVRGFDRDEQVVDLDEDEPE